MKSTFTKLMQNENKQINKISSSAARNGIFSVITRLKKFSVLDCCGEINIYKQVLAKFK